MEYPKIETVFVRDEQTHKVLPGQIRLREFLLPSRWMVTEKIDGTNIRIILNNGDPANLTPAAQVFYRGRTDAAQMPPFLLTMLQERFPPAIVAAAFDPGTEAIIFGEGYGPRIQKGGGLYRKDPGFRVFDVAVLANRVWWLNWSDVEDVARKIGAETVPVLARDVTLGQARAMLIQPSATAGQDGGEPGTAQEGIVVRTDPLLFTRTGARVMWKLKAKDL